MDKELYRNIDKINVLIDMMTTVLVDLSLRMKFIEDELSKVSDKAFDDFKRQFED